MFWAKKKELQTTLEQAYKNNISALEKQVSVLNALVKAQSEGIELQDKQIEELKKTAEIYQNLVERGVKLNEDLFSIISLQEQTILDLKRQNHNLRQGPRRG